MSDDRTREIEQTHARYLEVRGQAERGEVGWEALAEFFTDDAVDIDPAWGRVDGIEAIRHFLRDSMAGLDGWKFPHQWQIVEGDRLVSCWKNRLPGTRDDGSRYETTGLSILTYDGEGRFSSEEDVLNIVHVTELVAESGWTPGEGFNPPPVNPPRGG